MANASCNYRVKLISHVTGRCALFNVKLHFFQIVLHFIGIIKREIVGIFMGGPELFLLGIGTCLTNLIMALMLRTCFFTLSDQTCDKGTKCIFSKYVDLDHNLRMCSEVFGLKPNEIERRANFSNAYYGADHPKGSRIVFVNGKFLRLHSRQAKFAPQIRKYGATTG